VTRGQLLAAGISAAAVHRRVRNGALVALYPGVYRVAGAPRTRDSDYMAAVLATGERAAICDLAAGHLLTVTRGAPPPPAVVVPVDRNVRGLSVRRCRTLNWHDVTVVNGIRVTTAPRTLVDLAALLPEDTLALAAHEAQVRHGVTPQRIEKVLGRRQNSPGATKLRRVIRGDVRVVLSELERVFLVLLMGEGLPLPATNVVASGRYVDCRWPEYRLTVELQSYLYHSTRHSWEQDYRREREAYARGDKFRRFIWADVFEDTTGMLGELRGSLS
jgi:hypothetical protein